MPPRTHEAALFDQKGSRALDFDLTTDQQLLKDLAGKFCADHYDLPRRKACQAMPMGFNMETWRLMAELGLLAIPFSEADGGFGGGRVELMILGEAFGAGLGAEPYLGDILLAARLIAEAGTPEQKESWLPEIFSARSRLVLAHLEHGAGYDLNHVDTTATPTRAGWQLNGHKTLVLAGPGADAYLVSALGADGCSLFLVPASATGLNVRPYRLLDGSLACELELTNVLAEEQLSGGLPALLAIADDARLMICAEMVGAMQAMLDATLDYVRTRKQFGRPIGQFQAVQHRLADLYAKMELCRSILYRAALGDAADLAAAKACISDEAVLLGEGCIQLHGGIGVTDELMLGHWHKRILLLSRLLGDPDSELERYTALVMA